MYHGNVKLGTLVDMEFNTSVGGIPTTITSASVKAYIGSSTTEITATGMVLSIDHDGAVGVHHIQITPTVANGFARRTNVTIRALFTLDGVAIVLPVGSFSIENRHIPGLIREMTAAGGAVGSVTLDAAGTAIEGAAGNLMIVVDGTGAGQSAIFAEGYDNGTKVVPFVDNVGVALDATSVIEIYASPPASTIEDFATLLNDFIANEHDPLAALVALIDAKTTNLPTDPADASVIAAAFATIPDLVWDAAAAGHVLAGTFGLFVNNANSSLGTLLATAKLYKKNTAVSKFQFPMRQTDGTPALGKTVTVLVNKDGGVFGAPADAVTEVAQGFYEVDLSATEMNGDEIGFIASAAGCQTLMAKIRTQTT